MKRPLVITLLLLFALSAAPGCSVKHDGGAQIGKAAVSARR
jgi:hypothetical protein